MPRISLGGWGWIGTATLVVCVDAAAIAQEASGRAEVAPTMSHSFDAAMQHPVRRWPTMLALAVIVAHLLRVLGERDPLCRAGDVGCQLLRRLRS